MPGQNAMHTSPPRSDAADLSPEMLALLLAEHRRDVLPRLELFWRYFRNPMEPVTLPTRPGAPLSRGLVSGAGGCAMDGAGAVSPRACRTAQEAGLPPRITGVPDPSAPLLEDRVRPRREVVIENDIGWRVQTMVDFMFGKPVQIVSTAADEGKRREIERVLDAVWEASGGIALLQDVALLGHVFGHVDLVLRINEPALAGGGRRFQAALASGSGEALAQLLRVEAVDPRRGIAMLNADDARVIDAYLIHVERQTNELEAAASARPARRWLIPGHVPGPAPRPRRRRSELTEVLLPGLLRVLEDGEVIGERRSVLLPGVLPVAHIQNLSQPSRYEGLGEVEPLIALQDELNTRLSDRAHRVTMQSFQMYLARRLDGFEKAPIGPGLVWSTNDPEATIESFGGDSASPSESEHIEQIREAMDKISGVPPLAGGVVRARIGNLSSATALRITLLGLLSKTARKRVTYGRGIAQVSRMMLAALDAAGALRTRPEERGIRLIWPDPQPADIRDEVAAAQARLDLGVPRERVLAELGYAPTDPGVA